MLIKVTTNFAFRNFSYEYLLLCLRKICRQIYENSKSTLQLAFHEYYRYKVNTIENGRKECI